MTNKPVPTTPAVQSGWREKIAGIIDPFAWDWEHSGALRDAEQDRAIRRSLAKADAILALLPSLTEGETNDV